MTLGTADELTADGAREKLDALMARDRFVRDSASIIGTAEIVLSRPWGQMPESLNDSHSRGAWSLLRVTADLIGKGLHPFQPVVPAAPCDLLVLMPDWTVVRVEVKTARIEAGKVACDVSRNIGKFDVLAAVTPDGAVRYISSSDITDLLYPFKNTLSCVLPQSIFSTQVIENESEKAH